MDNVVTAIFNVESEAYQAFTTLRNKPYGEGYVVAEAALIKCEGDVINVVDSFDLGVTADDTAAGMMIGSLVGILGGPLGVLLGASVGGLTGSMMDTDDAIDSVSMLEATALKLYDNDCAIIAFVQEDEPAFDAAFEGFDTTIIRHFAADVYDEVDRARELELQLANEARQQLRAERKAARKEKFEDSKASISSRFEAIKKKYAEKKVEKKAEKEELKQAMEEAASIAEAEYVASTKEMLGEE